ncbi:MAG: hypothetical protein Q7U16_04410 [Agitococcus sp.]|nr:hypothetical protein [Agitococcus sp.]
MQCEPAIQINGRILTEAQAMTVRVAIENFSVDVAGDGLGSDERGLQIAAAYRERVAEIRHVMYNVAAPAMGTTRTGKTRPWIAQRDTPDAGKGR